MPALEQTLSYYPAWSTTCKHHTVWTCAAVFTGPSQLSWGHPLPLYPVRACMAFDVASMICINSTSQSLNCHAEASLMVSCTALGHICHRAGWVGG